MDADIDEFIARDDAPALLALMAGRPRSVPAVMRRTIKAGAAACALALAPHLGDTDIFNRETHENICRHDMVELARVVIARRGATITLLECAVRHNAIRCIEHVAGLLDMASVADLISNHARKENLETFVTLMDHGYVPSTADINHAVSKGWCDAFDLIMSRPHAAFIVNNTTCTAAMFNHLYRRDPAILADMYYGRTVAQIIRGRRGDEARGGPPRAGAAFMKAVERALAARPAAE